MSYTGFMLLISMGTAVVFQTDNLIIASFLGVAYVAPYAVALRVTRTLTLFIHRIPDVLFPFYSGMRAQGDKARLRENFLVTARLELVAGMCFALGLAFAGPTVLRIWVGGENVIVLPAFALAVTLVALEAIVHPAAVLAAATGGERSMAAMNNAEAILNLVFSLLLVRRLGVVGVIGGTVAAQAITNLWWMPRWAMRHLAVSLHCYFAKVISPSLVPALTGGAAGLLVLAGLESTWSNAALAGGGVAMIVYSVAYLGFGAGARERNWLLSRLP
jgi:O-antigen/teichoic acid export membrane protein